MMKTILLVSAMIMPTAVIAQTGPTETDPALQSTGSSPSTEIATQDTATAQVGAGQAPAPGAVVAATATDVKAGAVVNDQAGQAVGTIESVSSEGAVIATGQSRAQVPLAAFAKKDGALVIGMTKVELDAAVAARKPSS